MCIDSFTPHDGTKKRKISKVLSEGVLETKENKKI